METTNQKLEAINVIKTVTIEWNDFIELLQENIENEYDDIIIEDVDILEMYELIDKDILIKSFKNKTESALDDFGYDMMKWYYDDDFRCYGSGFMNEIFLHHFETNTFLELLCNKWKAVNRDKKIEQI